MIKFSTTITLAIIAVKEDNNTNFSVRTAYTNGKVKIREFSKLLTEAGIKGKVVEVKSYKIDSLATPDTSLQIAIENAINNMNMVVDYYIENTDYVSVDNS